MATATSPQETIRVKASVPAVWKRRHNKARKLTEALGNKVEVRFDPCSFMAGDSRSGGHQFSVWCYQDASQNQCADELWLDDRKPMLPQLSAGLRDIAKYYIELAVEVEALEGKGGAS